MCDFKYVSKNEYVKYKGIISEIIQLAQKDLKKDFTFSFQFVGPCSKNMVTICEEKYIGYDFDLKLIINDTSMKTEDIKLSIMKKLNIYLKQYGYDKCIDDSKFIVIKLNDPNYLALKHSLYIEIAKENEDDYSYILKNKDGNYCWHKETKGALGLNNKYDLLVECGLKEFIKYQYLKRKNAEPNKKSMLVYEECIAAIYHEFYDNDRSFL